ncbi:Amino acid transporter family [Giardia lamblia P15]|uniref:Amino acid transporter family n=1 Tax=Giardia intestinalis (strain P15) TaxID=658858 RepID=E1F786_GIAIA|nr:Amino acid transporter family [Giardia lamblia P15]
MCAMGLNTAMTIVNGVIGAGMLALGDTFYSMGLIGATIILIGSAVVIYFSFIAINEAVYYTKSKTFRELFIFIFGPVFATIIDVANTLILSSYLIGYIVIASQYSLGFITSFGGKIGYDYDTCYARKYAPQCYQHYVAVVIVTVIIVPLICFRGLNFLNYVSIVATIMVLFTTVTLVVLLCNHARNRTPVIDTETCLVHVKPYPPSSLHFMIYAAFPITLYLVHSSIPPMFAEMRGQSMTARRRIMNIAIMISVPVTTVINLIMGIVGSTMFTKPKDNILNTFKPGDENKIISGIRVAMSCVVIVSYPIILLPVRASIMRWIPYNKMNGRTDTIVFYSVGFGVTLLCMGVAMLYPNIGEIFNYAASIFGIFVTWIAPLMIIMYMPRIRAMGKPTEDFDDRDVKNLNATGTELTEMTVTCNESSYMANSSTVDAASDKQPPKGKQTSLRKRLRKGPGRRRLPDIKLPKWRYAVFGTCMALATIYNLSSFVINILNLAPEIDEKCPAGHEYPSRPNPTRI